MLELSNSDELWAEPAMHAENFVVDKGCDRHAVEDILKLLPHANGVAALAFVVEAIDAVDLSALVVTAQQEEVFLELDFVCQEQDDGLQRVLSSVDIIAQKEIVGLRREAAILEKTEQVSELSMGVA